MHYHYQYEAAGKVFKYSPHPQGPAGSSPIDCSSLVYNMKLISIFASLLCASTAVVEAAPRKPATIWKRPKPLIERRVAGRDFSNPEIQKRAQSYFATAKTKRESGIPRLACRH